MHAPPELFQLCSLAVQICGLCAWQSAQSKTFLGIARSQHPSAFAALANMLLCRVPEGQPANAQMAAIFQPLLSACFTHAYSTAQRSLDAYNQLVALLDLWAARGVYGAEVVNGIKGQMLAQVRHSLQCVKTVNRC